MRLVITRPRAQAAAWLQVLNAQGVAAAALPLIEIAPLPDLSPLRVAGQALSDWQFVMFVSANAVEQFVAAQAPGWHWPAATRAGATGPGTVQALRRAGVSAELIDAPGDEALRWDSEALWQRIGPRAWAGRRVLVVRGEEGRDWLAEQWRAQGAELQFLAAYRRGAPVWDDAERALWAQLLQAPQQVLWHFSASEAVRHLVALQPQWPQARALVTHERIAEATRGLGLAEVRLIAATAQAAATAWHEAQSAPSRSVQSRAP